MVQPACNHDQIVNPKSKRCVKIAGSVVSQLVQAYNEGALQFALEDLKKLVQDSKYSGKIKLSAWDAQQLSQNMADAPASPEPKKAPIAKKKKEKSTIHLSEALLARVKRVAQQAKQRVAERYVNPDHKKYCKLSKSKRDTVLHPPVLNKMYVLSLPVYMLQHQNMMLHLHDPTLHKTKPYFVVSNRTFKIYTEFDTHNEAWRLREGLFHSHARTTEQLMQSWVDAEWFNKQNEYIASLPLRSLYTLLGYTNVGDVMVNHYHRGTLTSQGFYNNFSPVGAQYTNFLSGIRMFPLFFAFLDELRECTYQPISKGKEHVHVTVTFPIAKNTYKETVETYVNIIKTKQQNQTTVTDYHCYMYMMHIGAYLSMHFWKKVIQRFSDELQSLLRGAPKVNQMMTVYRGVKKDYYLNGTTDPKGKVYLQGKTFFRNDGFVSTSMDVDKAFRFVDPTALLSSAPKTSPRCCFQRITLLPGTSCLLLTGMSYFEEMEVLLGRDTVYYIRTSKQKKFYTPSSNKEYCYEDAPHVPTFVSDVVVVK